MAKYTFFVEIKLLYWYIFFENTKKTFLID
jgi:hypothetical protein